jgi:hypothetical protein
MCLAILQTLITRIFLFHKHVEEFFFFLSLILSSLFHASSIYFTFLRFLPLAFSIPYSILSLAPFRNFSVVFFLSFPIHLFLPQFFPYVLRPFRISNTSYRFVFLTSFPLVSSSAKPRTEVVSTEFKSYLCYILENTTGCHTPRLLSTSFLSLLYI